MSVQLFLRSKGLSLPQLYYYQRYISIICRLWLFTIRSHLVLISQSFLLLSSLVAQWCPVQGTYTVFCENLLKSGLSYRILFKIHIVLCEFSTAHIRVCIDSSHNGNILLKILSL